MAYLRYARLWCPMATARKIVNEPNVLTTLKSHEIEAQVRPLMLAILKSSDRSGWGFREIDPNSPDSAIAQLNVPSETRPDNWEELFRPETRRDNWEELFRLVQQPVLKVLRYVFAIGNVEDQDDMFQEVMLRFYRYHLSYDSSRPLLPWLYAIARNVKLDWQAKSRLRVQSATVEQRSSDNVTLKLIAEDVLAKLPEDDRRILWLSYNEGLSDAEISVHLNIPLTTTKYYLRRAKKRARDFLTAHPRQGGEHEK